MPVFLHTLTLSRPPVDVFEFLSDPANLVKVTPPEFHMRLIEAPSRLQLGARVVIEGRRWGMPQRIVSEITTFEPPSLMVDEQREGIFRSWKHVHLLESSPAGGTEMTDRIEFEAPGGLLGFVVTQRRITDQLEGVFTYRSAKFRELLKSGANR